MKSIERFALAALAAAALAAFPAAASASGGFTADEYPATVKGSQAPNPHLYLSFHGQEIGCSNMTLEATLNKVGPISTSSIKNPDCGFAGYIEMKGCQLEFHPESKTVDIVPSGCGPVKLYFLGCAGYPLSIPAQKGISAEYENVGSGSTASVQVTIEDSSVEYSTGDSLCKKAGTYTDLAIIGELKLSATNSKKSSIGISATSGLFLEGGTPETGEPRITAPVYPAQVTGGVFDLETEGWEAGQTMLFEQPTKGEPVPAICDGVEYDGGQISEPLYNEFTLDAEYSECALGGIATDVDMSSCQYVYSDMEEVGAGSYEATADIACDEGDAIGLDVSGICTIEIPAQTLTDPASLANPELGYEGEIGVAMASDDLEYTMKGSFCAFAGLETRSGEDGSSHSDMLLRGI